ncbi:Uncharacterized protein APZ42_025735, partial [Daphnia magna]
RTTNRSFFFIIFCFGSVHQQTGYLSPPVQERSRLSIQRHAIGMSELYHYAACSFWEIDKSILLQKKNAGDGVILKRTYVGRIDEAE